MENIPGWIQIFSNKGDPLEVHFLPIKEQRMPNF
jgi:hypothetical protein